MKASDGYELDFGELDLSALDLSPIEQCSGRIVVAYSGGLDSHVLLLLIKKSFPDRSIHALHINHGLHADADQWEEHCLQICRELGVACKAQKVQVERSGNLENEARIARYRVFEEFLNEGDLLLLGHHQDDQVETLFLKMFRGDAPIGLLGMPVARRLGKASLYRPLLKQRRKNLETYAKRLDLEWIEDSSNDSLEFDRNFLRHQIIPQLASRWPRLKTTLIQHEEHTKAAQSELKILCELDLEEIALPPNRVDLKGLKKLSHLRQINLMRDWLNQEGVQHLPSKNMLSESLNAFFQSGEDAKPRLSWRGIVIERYSDILYLHKDLRIAPQKKHHLDLNDFIRNLDSEVATTFDLELENGHLAFKSGGLLSIVGGAMSVRHRNGGEKMKFGEHHKSLKNIFQENKMPSFLRDHWPLVYFEEELVLIPGLSAWGVPSIVAPAHEVRKGQVGLSIDWQL